MMEAWKKKYYTQRMKVLMEESEKHADTLELMIEEMEHIEKELYDS